MRTHVRSSRVSACILGGKEMKARWFLTLVLLLAQLLAGCAPAEGVIPVKPSGGDDTAAIQAAFDQAVATPGRNGISHAAAAFSNGVLMPGLTQKSAPASAANSTSAALVTVPAASCSRF